MCRPGWDIGLLCQFIWSCHWLALGWGHIRHVVDFFFSSGTTTEGGVRPPARLSAQSAVAGRPDVPFRESSPSRCTLWKTLEKSAMDGTGGLTSVGAVEANVSHFNIPTVPFKAMNFHFRGRSKSVTASLVLLSRSTWWCICLQKSSSIRLKQTFLYYFACFLIFL